MREKPMEEFSCNCKVEARLKERIAELEATNAEQAAQIAALNKQEDLTQVTYGKTRIPVARFTKGWRGK